MMEDRSLTSPLLSYLKRRLSETVPSLLRGPLDKENSDGEAFHCAAVFRCESVRECALLFHTGHLGH